MRFSITGGKSGECITMYHTIPWSGDNSKWTSDWYWENEYDNSSFGFEWKNGVTVSRNGTFTIEFYNADDNSYINRISIPVGN